MSGTAARIQASIEAHDWHVIKVPEDEEGPGFAYSVGLQETFGHPEVIVFGLPLDVMHGIVNTVGEEVRRGRRFSDGGASDEVLDGQPVCFLSVAASRHAEFLGQAVDYYGGAEFSALQCYWPDPGGAFPWQVGFDVSYAVLQTSLQDVLPGGPAA